MFAVRKDEWKEEDVEGSGEGRNRRDEIRVRENGKTVCWASAAGAEISRVF